MDMEQTIGEVDWIPQDRLSLNELLGNDWLNRCVLGKDNPTNHRVQQLISKASEVVKSGTNNKTETSILKMNEIFTESNSGIHARIIKDENNENEDKILIQGKIEDNDYFMLCMNFVHIFTYQNPKTVEVKTTNLWILDDQGNLIDLVELGKIRKKGQEPHNLHLKNKFFSIENEPYGNIMTHVTSSYLNAPFPNSTTNLAAFFHEVGHLLRFLHVIDIERKKKINSGLIFLKLNREITDEWQLDSIRVLSEEERSASAIAMSMMKEIGSRTNLRALSKPFIEEGYKNLQKCLSSYDEVVIARTKGNKAEGAPSFSQEIRHIKPDSRRYRRN